MYRIFIKTACGCSYEDSFEVEDMIRNAVGGTLDHLSREELSNHAKTEYAALLAERKKDPNWSPDPAMKAARARAKGAT